MSLQQNIFLGLLVTFLFLSKSLKAAEAGSAKCSPYPMLVNIEDNGTAIKKIRIEEGPKYVLIDTDGLELAILNCQISNNGKLKGDIKMQSRLKRHETNALSVVSLLGYGYDIREELGIKDYYIAKETPIRTYLTTYGQVRGKDEDYSRSLRISDHLLGAKGSIKLNCFPKPAILFRREGSTNDKYAQQLYALPERSDCTSKVLRSIQWTSPIKTVLADRTVPLRPVPSAQTAPAINTGK